MYSPSRWLRRSGTVRNVPQDELPVETFRISRNSALSEAIPPFVTISWICIFVLAVTSIGGTSPDLTSTVAVAVMVIWNVTGVVLSEANLDLVNCLFQRNLSMWLRPNRIRARAEPGLNET